jgi:hypothetical protein
MLRQAAITSGLDAARLLGDVHPDQLYALVGLLLTNAQANGKTGGRQIANQCSEDERKAGHRRFRAGARDALTVAQHREYARLYMRRYRQRTGQQMPRRAMLREAS